MALDMVKMIQFRHAWIVLEPIGLVDSLDGAQYRRLWHAYAETSGKPEPIGFIRAHTKNRRQTHDDMRDERLCLG